MNKHDNLEADIGYVRDAVGRSERVASPATIYLLWAAICLVGFALVDFAPTRVGLFWAIAGPVGSVISGMIGWRHSLRRGQLRRDIGLRHALHWGSMLVAIWLLIPLGVTGVIAWEHLSRIILLIVSFGYVLAGAHLDRPLLWVGLLMAAGYVSFFFINSYAWTILGVVVACGLVAASVIQSKSDVEARG